MPVIELGESERKAVLEKDNELSFRDVEFRESVGRLKEDVSRFQKRASEVLKVLWSSLEHSSETESKWPQTAVPLVFNELSNARPIELFQLYRSTFLKVL